MHQLYHKLYAVRQALHSRTVAVSLLFAAMAAIMITMASLINTICINDNGQTTLLHTIERDPFALLEDNGIVTLSTDIVDFTGIEDGYGEINIVRSFPITVTADNKTQTIYVIDETVEGVLNSLDIDYDSDDILTPSPEKFLEEEDQIVLQRVEYVTRSEEIVIPHETETRPSSLLRKGRRLTLQAGKDGVKTMSYMQRTVDGVVEDEKLVTEAVTTVPVTERILVGEDAPVSPLDFGIPTDKNGAPLHYKTLLTNQVATGYNSRRARPRGASGMALSAGYVAVHPEKIPYGTRMYITSADGSFVYGYAIAADTGVGLLEDVIDVDLYYDTYTESCLNGKRNVNIYILD